MHISQHMYQEVCDLLDESEEHCEALINESILLKKEIEGLKILNNHLLEELDEKCLS